MQSAQSSFFTNVPSCYDLTNIGAGNSLSTVCSNALQKNDFENILCKMAVILLKRQYGNWERKEVWVTHC